MTEGSWVQILLEALRLGTLAISFSQLFWCRSEETLKAVGPFYLFSVPGKCNIRHRGYMCNLSWIPPFLEKDNSQILVLTVSEEEDDNVHTGRVQLSTKGQCPVNNTPQA